MTGVRGDLGDPASLTAALADLRPEVVAFTAWTRQETEAEDIAAYATLDLAVPLPGLLILVAAVVYTLARSRRARRSDVV